MKKVYPPVIFYGGFTNTIQCYDSVSDFPTTGRNGVIYIAKDTDKTYIWDSDTSTYVEIDSTVPVIDNLTSTSTTSALSANQGRVLDQAKIEALVDDTTPQLGGNLDAQSNDIDNVANLEVETSMTVGATDSFNAEFSTAFFTQNTGANNTFSARTYSNTLTHRNAFTFNRYGGTESTPTAVSSNMQAFVINVNAYDGTSNRTIGQMQGFVDTYTASNNVSGRFCWATRNDGVGAALIDHFEIAKDGGIFMYNLLGGAIGANPQVWYNTTTKELAYDTSALKYKINIRNLTNTSWIYDLEPRLFDEKEGNRKNLMGLIAEEAKLVNPDLVFYKPGKKEIYVEAEDDIGNLVTVKKVVDDLDNIQIEGVAYQMLIVPMLKEIQKLKLRLDAMQAIA